MVRDLAELDTFGAADAIRQGFIRPRTYAEALLERAQASAGLNALYCIDAENIIKRAEETAQANPESALAGLPLVAKDNINTSTLPTTGGTPALRNHTPNTDAGVVRRVVAAGGFIGAKSSMHELAFGITSNNTGFGAVRNPIDPAMIPGGSSGGTAAAVAAGIFPSGLGTDTGGSCRIPAALCGVIGFRPSTTRYPGDGVIPISQTRDTVGPIARTVRDIVLLDSILANDPGDIVRVDLTSVRLGIPRPTFYDNLDPMVEHEVETALKCLTRAGASLIEISLEEIQPHNLAFGFPVAFYEVMRDLPAYLAAHAPSVTFEALIESIASPDVSDVFQSQYGEGAIPEAVYHAALEKHRPNLLRIYEETFQAHGLDAIVFPTTPLPARPIGEDETVELNGERVSTFLTYIRNTDSGSNIGAPGISLPCPGASDLPVGIEFDALPGKDRSLLGLAAAVERAFAH